MDVNVSMQQFMLDQDAILIACRTANMMIRYKSLHEAIFITHAVYGYRFRVYGISPLLNSQSDF